MSHFDVIIIGGRPAGASLALRLAKQNLNVLLVDKATFPSLPNVPSSPLINVGTMRLLDELGFAEEDYVYSGGKFTHFAMDYVGLFQVRIPIAAAGLDRQHYYGLDRTRFDNVLWERAASQPTITAKSDFSVNDILRDNHGQVNGITGRNAEGVTERFTADLVVGADGRFSFAARKFGAAKIFELNDNPTASYHAEWENVEPYSAEFPTTASIYNFGTGFFVLCIPIDDRKYIIGTYTRAENARVGAQNLEAEYRKALESVPELQARLRNAQQVTRVVGVNPIENGYREATGAGWALVGDAVHYKDPIDGQGIYDALMGSKLLAEAIYQWKHKGVSWEDAGAEYEQRFRDASYPMLLQTVARAKQELTPAPKFILKTLVRWMLSDPDFQRDFIRYSSRVLNPADFKPGPTPRIILRGLLNDLRARLKASRTASETPAVVREAPVS
jgi:flavin-dependent dehydrogenase